MVETVAVNMMRPVSRHFDEHEHEIPWDYINFMHQAVKSMGGTSMAPEEGPKKEADPEKKKRPPIAYQRLAHMVEMLAWGDAGMYLCIPGGLLGSAAVAAAGTPDQKKRFLSRMTGPKPTFDAMAMTEPQAGSDTSAIRATAVLDEATQEWILNGEKIFVTAGHKALIDSEGFVVVWASIDPSAGRAGMRAFVVEAGTPGCTVTKMEHKLGIRVSDTVSVVFQNCRIPYENILGSPTVEKSTKGFKGAMATFDATRPIVAAQAIGIAHDPTRPSLRQPWTSRAGKNVDQLMHGLIRVIVVGIPETIGRGPLKHILQGNEELFFAHQFHKSDGVVWDKPRLLERVGFDTSLTESRSALPWKPVARLVFGSHQPCFWTVDIAIVLQ